MDSHTNKSILDINIKKITEVTTKNIQNVITNTVNSNSIIVSDIDEAIAQINYNGNRYSSAIFTSSTENASKFIKQVKSKIVTINISPTIERIIDINQSDLTIEKTIIYPFSFKFDGNNDTIQITDDESI